MADISKVAGIVVGSLSKVEGKSISLLSKVEGQTLLLGNYSVGGIIKLSASTIPTDYLECNGAAVSRTTYASLFSAIGTAWGYGDNSTTFNLPDMRGEFPRGYDHGVGLDPDRASRTASATGGATGDNVGTQQGYGLKSHTHTLQYDSGTGSVSNVGSTAGGTSGGGSINTDNQGGNETRSINAYAVYAIKY